MVSWSEDELDAITDEFLAMMLDKREFIQKWTSNVEAEVARMQVEAMKNNHECAAMNGATKPEDTLVAMIEELVHAVDASSQTFLSSADFNICHCEPEHNRDASLLFVARLQIDRIATHNVGRKRCESASRRLLQLLRLFSTRISSAFQISNTSAFATSLCDMLYTFCDSVACSVCANEQNIVCELRRAVDDFNEIAVEKLSKKAFEMQCAKQKTAKPIRQQFFSPQPTRLRRPLVQIQQRSPGYLLPLDIVKKRQKMARTRSVPSIKSMIPAEAWIKKKTRPVTQAGSVPVREGNRSYLTNSAPLARKSSAELEKEEDEAALRLARKISSEVIKDLRKKYGKADIGMLGI